MYKVDFICLANSTKEGGRCIAGLRTDGKGWVRLVSTLDGGPLFHRHYKLGDGSVPEIYNVISVELEKHVPLPHHPENWLIAPTCWQLVKKCVGAQQREFIEQYVHNGPDLLGDDRDAVNVSELTNKPILSSLQLVRPIDLRWIVEESQGKCKVRTSFRVGATQYNLPFTDPEFCSRLLRRGVGSYPFDAIGISSIHQQLLTISLTGPFNEKCYKLVSTLILQPETRRPNEKKAFNKKYLPDWLLPLLKHLWRSFRV